MLTSINDAVDLFIQCHNNKSKTNQDTISMIFDWAANQSDPDILEELKNRLYSCNYNLHNIIANLRIDIRMHIYITLNSNIIANQSNYKYKIISDIDNTAIENKYIAKCKYIHREMIPGWQYIMELLTNGVTTISLLTTKPQFIMKKSKNNLASTLRFHYFDSFVGSLVELCGSKLDSVPFQDTHDLYHRIAEYKFSRINNLRMIYPNSIFIFFGDDTQSDPLLARMIVENINGSYAFIRECEPILPINTKTKLSHRIEVNNLFYHSSYYEVLHILLQLNLISINNLSNLTNAIQYESNKYDKYQVAYDTCFIRKLTQHNNDSVDCVSSNVNQKNNSCNNDYHF